MDLMTSLAFGRSISRAIPRGRKLRRTGFRVEGLGSSCYGFRVLGFRVLGFGGLGLSGFRVQDDYSHEKDSHEQTAKSCKLNMKVVP